MSQALLGATFTKPKFDWCPTKLSVKLSADLKGDLSMILAEEEDTEDGEGVVRPSKEIWSQAKWNQVS